MFARHPQDLIGKQVGAYIIKGYIATGGFGHVFKVEHVRMGKIAALKMLKPELFSNREIHEAFEKEARIVGSLEHPHILTAFDYAFYNQVPFMVMPFIHCGSIKALHPKGTRVPLNTVVEYVKQIASALQYAHDRKLVHRDLKPENILVGPYGLLLTDFGIAVTAHSNQSLSPQGVSGTPQFMAPEQFSGKAQITSDIYSLGIIVYQWLTGILPFEAADFAGYAYQHATGKIPSLREQGLDIQSAVEEVIFTSLAKSPQDRFQSAMAFANALEQAAMQLDESILLVVQSPADELTLIAKNIPATIETLTAVSSASIAENTTNVLAQAFKQAIKSGKPTSAPGSTLMKYTKCSDSCVSLAWSPDGKTLASLHGNSIHMWDVLTGVDETMFDVGNYQEAISWLPDGSNIITAGCYGGVTLWDSNTGGKVSTLHTDPADQVKLLPNGKWVVIHTGNKLSVISTKTGNVGATYQGDAMEYPSLPFDCSPDGKTLATANEEYEIHVWDIATEQKYAIFLEHDPEIEVDAIAWSSDGMKVASVDKNFVSAKLKNTKYVLV